MRKKPINNKQEFFWEILPQYDNLINKIIHKYSNTTEDFSDIKSEALIFYGEIYSKYNFELRASRKSFIGNHIKFTLINYLIKRNREKRDPSKLSYLEDTEELIPNGNSSVLENLIFREKLANLSFEAKEVLNIIFDTPYELLELSRNKIIQYLGKKNKYWDREFIEEIFMEIKEIL